jgi:hypothetical protein
VGSELVEPVAALGGAVVGAIAWVAKAGHPADYEFE